MNLICLQFSQVELFMRCSMRAAEAESWSERATAYSRITQPPTAGCSRLQRRHRADQPRGPAFHLDTCIFGRMSHFFFSLLHTYGDGWGNYCSLSSRWTIISTIRRQKMLVQVEIGKESTWRAQCQASAARPRYFQIHHRVRIQRHWPVWYSSSSISVDVPNLLRKTAASFWSLPLTFGLIRRLLGIVVRIASLRRAKTWHDT